MTSLVLAYFGFICVLSTTFDCSEDNQCASQNLKCDDGEDCFIYCTRYQSCRYTTFTCPKSNSANVNVSCNVICGDGTTISAQTCYSTTIDAYYSDVFSLNINGVDGQQVLVQDSMKITCPCDGKCNIDCDSSCRYMTVNAEQAELTITSAGEQAYNSMYVRAEYASKLTMTGSGSESFYYAYIYCPQTENGNPKCNLEYTGDYRGFFSARIYAINSFWDLNMICNGPQGFSTEQCYFGSTSTDTVNPRMYCLSDYPQNCAMATDDGINWVCTDSTNICAVTQLDLRSVDNIECEAPTESPTDSPTRFPTVIVLSVVAVLFIIIVVGSLLHCRRMKNVKSKKFVEIKENYQSVNEKPQDHSLSSIQLEGE